MCHLVNAYRNCQDYNVVLPWVDCHAVAVAQPEPFLGYLGHLIAAFTDGVLMVQNVAFHIQVRTAFDLNYPTVSNWGYQGFLDCGEVFTLWSFNLHAVFNAQHTLLHLGKLIAVRVFEDQGLSHAQRLAVDFEYPLALLVLDPEIVAYGDHLLAHLVAVAPTAPTAELAVVLALFTSILSFASYNIFSLLVTIKSFHHQEMIFVNIRKFMEGPLMAAPIASDRFLVALGTTGRLLNESANASTR